MSIKFSDFNTQNGDFPSVVVTGIEAYTSLAPSIELTWEKLLAGESGIRALTDKYIDEYGIPVKIGGRLKFNPADELSKVELRRLSYVQQLGITLVRKLWQKIGSPEVDPERLAVYYGCGGGDMEITANAVLNLEQGGYRKISPFTIQMGMPNGPAGAIAVELGAKGGAVTPVSACATGNEAIANAWRAIVLNEADMVITGGVEGRIDPVPLACFSMMRALSTRNDEPTRASRPFAKDRDGFVFGEAAAMLVLETEAHAKARGAKIYARVMGAGITSDGYHLVAPDPNGTGAARAITKALRTAGLAKTDITLVNAHATSTSVGDSAEAKAINSAIGSHPKVYAPKSALGHSIGSVGALEAILTVLSLNTNTIPPTLNQENPDPEIDLDVVSQVEKNTTHQYALNNSFGFGGHNVATIFGKY